mmetsp:Transcript_29949/g.47782  ORF Transcript_29949/g.47782 Transcript_29949/m.47782 type:complete len:103 (-) Transcript_29949:143-451(-)|eukprot:CAMPEP_0197037200 /NCGR_PEP_ID=MMETSP1384-20130603/14467_1 /TAXON_ID=29189 /ORGANISM="Ammonia sp." /LENGTH=102 /DNA_ID=CAMNT_0042467467 /DNA_START=38 /DNA_END=346 /DNA_ORIENTATION=+
MAQEAKPNAKQEKKSGLITVIKGDDRKKYESWSVWKKEKSKFDWSYDSKETCYIIKGKVTVTPTKGGGDAVSFGAGDVVIFEKGLECVWEIHEDVEKYYNFE